MASDDLPNLDRRIKAACDALASIIAVVDPIPAATAACALLARHLNGASVAIIRGGRGWAERADVVIARYPVEDPATFAPSEPRPERSGPEMLIADLDRSATQMTSLIARRGRRVLPFDETDREFFRAISAQISPLLPRLEGVTAEASGGPIDPETGIWGLGRFLEESARRFDRLDIEERPGTMLAFGWVRSDGTAAPEASSIIVRASVEVLQEMLRPTDLLGRIGPFRLAAWCDGVDHLIAAERAARIGSRLDMLLAPSSRHVAIGIATRWTHRRDDTTSLLEQAGAALLKARSIAASKGCYVSYVWQPTDRVQ